MVTCNKPKNRCDLCIQYGRCESPSLPMNEERGEQIREELTHNLAVYRTFSNGLCGIISDDHRVMGKLCDLMEKISEGKEITEVDKYFAGQIVNGFWN